MGDIRKTVVSRTTRGAVACAIHASRAPISAGIVIAARVAMTIARAASLEACGAIARETSATGGQVKHGVSNHDTRGCRRCTRDARLSAGATGVVAQAIDALALLVAATHGAGGGIAGGYASSKRFRAEFSVVAGAVATRAAAIGGSTGFGVAIGLARRAGLGFTGQAMSERVAERIAGVIPAGNAVVLAMIYFADAFAGTAAPAVFRSAGSLAS